MQYFPWCAQYLFLAIGNICFWLLAIFVSDSEYLFLAQNVYFKHAMRFWHASNWQYSPGRAIASYTTAPVVYCLYFCQCATAPAIFAIGLVNLNRFTFYEILVLTAISPIIPFLVWITQASAEHCIAFSPCICNLWQTCNSLLLCFTQHLYVQYLHVMQGLSCMWYFCDILMWRTHSHPIPARKWWATPCIIQPPFPMEIVYLKHPSVAFWFSLSWICRLWGNVQDLCSSK